MTTFVTNFTASTPLQAYVDSANKMAGTYNTGSVFYSDPNGNSAYMGASTPIVAAAPTAAATTSTNGLQLPSWLQGDLTIGTLSMPKVAVYGGASIVLLLLLRH